MKNHRRAILAILVAGVLDVVGGILFAWAEHLSILRGLYWAIATATTVGYGDIVPMTPLGHVIAVVVMITVIPLFAATFSLITSGLTAVHVRAEGERIRDHVKEHTGEAQRLIRHVIKYHPDIPEIPLVEEGAEVP